MFLSRVHILNANLIVTTVERSEMIFHDPLVTHCFKFLSTRVCDCHDEIICTLRFYLNDGYLQKRGMLELVIYERGTYLEWSLRYSRGSTSSHLLPCNP